MIIKEIFKDDIDRKINGVVKVDQLDATTEREVNEYVVTKELRKHFLSFFNYYADGFNEPTDDIGVWISGFFGSGKSHFLKMLSYILANKEINGIKTVERFRNKFDDEGDFMPIQKSTKAHADTILFNIDIQSSINKDATAVIRVFAKMFYEHLGFYGENLKVAKLEQHISKRGKYEEFKKVFEEKNGSSWNECRDSFDFYEDEIVATLNTVLGMSEESAHNWFTNSTVEMSIKQLVKEIKEYTEAQDKDYRLLFMADEVGQYVGTNTDLLLNLQSLVEKIGSECKGKVWVICTGQSAIDEIIKVRTDEFSRIQARFKTRLALSSSSADEVIQKRILGKTPDAQKELESIYSKSDSVLKNLFSFQEAVLDIKGYNNADDFAKNYPFVPYQFIILQKVFSEIRKHGNSGKHLAGGERSMLSGFQEAAQKIKDKTVNTLAPFYLFYDTVHSFLDTTIRSVIERAERAAEEGNGLEAFDTDVLKLLYLVRYIGQDIPANIDNLVILCADVINMDTISKKATVQVSLDRLIKQNYVARTGDVYMFLTDEEQDVQSEINQISVDSTSVVQKLGEVLYGDILQLRKYRYGKKDFDLNLWVDTVSVGGNNGGLEFRLLSVVSDASDKDEGRLIMASQNSVIGILGNENYYEPMEHAMQIRRYVARKNVSQLPKSMQDIIKNQQNEADKLEADARQALVNALGVGCEYFSKGEKLKPQAKEPKSRCEEALEYLVTHLFSKIGLITCDISNDSDITSILKGKPNQLFDLTDAASEVAQYLELRDMGKISTNMEDVQKKFQDIPYGWKQIDVAAVVAKLIFEQQVTIKYGGASIQPDNPQLVDMLRKPTETGKTIISKRQVISSGDMSRAKGILREYFNVMDVPDDEDGLIKYITDHFEAQKEDLFKKESFYNSGRVYPDRHLIVDAKKLVNELLSQRTDNIALIKQLNAMEDRLLDSKDALGNLMSFFDNQKDLYDKTLEFGQKIADDMTYLEDNQAAVDAFNEIAKIVKVEDGVRFNYAKIPSLNGLKDTLETIHTQVLNEKKTELEQFACDCLGVIHVTCMKNEDATKNIVKDSDDFFTAKKAWIKNQTSIAILDSMKMPLASKKDQMLERIDNILAPKPTTPNKPSLKTVNKQIIFPAGVFNTEADVDAYVESIRAELKKLVRDNGGIKLS